MGAANALESVKKGLTATKKWGFGGMEGDTLDSTLDLLEGRLGVSFADLVYPYSSGIAYSQYFRMSLATTTRRMGRYK